MSNELTSYKGDIYIPVYGSVSDANVYLKDKVDALLAEKDAKIVELQSKVTLSGLANDCSYLRNKRCNYCSEIRKLRRELWSARAERAKEHVWHDVNADGSPKDDYKGQDWVLVQYQENGGFQLIPRVAEYRRHLKRWVTIDEDDIAPRHDYLMKDCKVIGWRTIDFAYYGKKFFIQQEINKTVERKCRAKAEEYK